MAMRIEDAINCLRADNCEKCKNYEECYEETCLTRIFDAIKMGANALEKQIPMKPKEVDFNTMGCPVCEHVVYVRHCYCAHCGQKLDWEGLKA